MTGGNPAKGESAGAVALGAAILWVVVLVAGWSAHPLGGSIRLFPQGAGHWDAAVVGAAWLRHAGTFMAAAVWVVLLAAWGAPVMPWCCVRTIRLRGQAALGMGFGLLGFALLGCGLAGLLSPGVLAAVAVAPCIPWIRRKAAGGLPAWPLPSAWWAAFALPILFALPCALAPETSWDAMVYHLRLPATFLLEHRHVALADNPFAGYPGLTELHYLFGLALTGSSDVAKLQHAACWLLTARVVWLAVLPQGVMAARGATLLWLAVPLGVQLAGMAYVDLATAWLTALAAALAFELDAAPAAACAGLAMATKYTGAFAVVGLAAVLPPRHWRRAAPWLIAAGGVWLARNWLALGNPAYPFATRWFGGVSSSAVEFWTRRPPGTLAPGSPPLWQHPWLALVADDGGVGVPLSPLWLAVAGFGWRRRAFRFAPAGAAVWLLLRLDVRFLLPLVPAALIAPGRAWASRPCRAAAFAALALGAPFAAAAVARGSLASFDPLPPALGLRTRAEHLRNGLDPAPEYFNVAGELAVRTPPRARLLYLAGIKTAYVPRRCSTAHQDICPVPLLRELRLAGSAPRLAIRLRQRGYTFLVDLIRATTSAVEGARETVTPAEATILVAWLRTDTAFAFRSGEAEVYAIGPRHASRRLGRVPLLEPIVVSRVTSGDPDAARGVAVLATLAPESSSASLAQGLSALLAPRPKLAEARRELETAVRDPEATALAWRGAGWAQDRTGAHDRALVSFRQAVALNPADVDSRFGAGMILAGAGWWDQAVVELATAARLAPGRADIRGALAAVETRRRQGSPR